MQILSFCLGKWLILSLPFIGVSNVLPGLFPLFAPERFMPSFLSYEHAPIPYRGPSKHDALCQDPGAFTPCFAALARERERERDEALNGQ